VLALICVFQCFTLLVIVHSISKLSGPFWTLLLVLTAASLVGAALGLLISALAPTTEAAIAFLPVVLLPFILLGGGIKPLHEMPSVARWIAAVTPTRWAYEANLLEEQQTRKSTFRNKLAQQLADSQSALAQCQSRGTPAAMRRQTAAAPAVATESDIAEAAFPMSNGRSALSQSLEVLGIFLGSLLILILGALATRATQ
jgi:hypothetical protein